MHYSLEALSGSVRSPYSIEAVTKTKGGLSTCSNASSPAHRGPQHIRAQCRAQQDNAQNMGRRTVAIVAGAALLLQSGPSLADVSMCAAEASNATVEASASVNAVMQEQNQTLQRSDDQAKRQVGEASSPQSQGAPMHPLRWEPLASQSHISAIFFDINSDGQPLGRIAVELFNDVPVGSLRFQELAEGHEGISYQLSKFNEIGPGFIRVADLQSLTYTAEKAASIAGGETVEQLEVEQQEAKHTHCQPGVVSLIIRDAKKRPTKERLVAYNGRLVTVQEQTGVVPNGSGFVITTAAQPALDATNLVVGRVVKGFDVVERIAGMPAVKANTGSPFFKVAKLAGDKRADVAEKGFGRPFSRVVIAQSGLGS